MNQFLETVMRNWIVILVILCFPENMTYDQLRRSTSHITKTATEKTISCVKSRLAVTVYHLNGVKTFSKQLKP